MPEVFDYFLLSTNAIFKKSIIYSKLTRSISKIGECSEQKRRAIGHWRKEWQSFIHTIHFFFLILLRTSKILPRLNVHMFFNNLRLKILLVFLKEKWISLPQWSVGCASFKVYLYFIEIFIWKSASGSCLI